MRSPRFSTTHCWRAWLVCIAGVAVQGLLTNAAEASCGDWLTDASMKLHTSPVEGLPHPSPCEQGNCHSLPHPPAPLTSTPTVQPTQEHWVCLLSSTAPHVPQRSSRLVELSLELPSGLAQPVERPPRAC